MTEEQPPAATPFSDLVRIHRRTVGLTREALAERAGLSVRVLSDIERGVSRKPQRETVRLLADSLGLVGGERARFEGAARAQPALFGGEDAPPPFAVPAPLTPIVGREAVVAAVCDPLRAGEVRLLTVVGMGGMGKTRVSIEAATRLQEDFPDGVWFVSLAPVREPDGVAAAILRTLGVEERAGQPAADTLVAALRERHALLVLDNCEQILSGMAVVASLLSRCPRLAILATSRERLNLYGERVLSIPPLALPLAGKAADVGAITDAPAVRVFVRAAREVRPDFAVSVANAAAVAAICAMLDGVPLALELAAARLATFTPTGLRAALAEQLPVLTGGARDVAQRHRTMRDALAWSERLLNAEERALFRRLSVFIGGFTSEAARAVCVPDVPAATAEEQIVSLVRKHLVRWEDPEHDPPRYSMMEVVRQYGQGQLDASGELDALRARHAAHFLALAEAAEEGSQGPEQVRLLAHLVAEHDNLHAALRRVQAAGDTATQLRLAANLSWYWETRGYFAEGLTYATAALDATEEAAAPALLEARIRLSHRASVLAWRAGDYPRARALAERSVALAREGGDPARLALSLQSLAITANAQGDTAYAQAMLEEAAALFRVAGDDLGLARVLNVLGERARYPGRDYAGAERLYTEALRLNRAGGNVTGAAVQLTNLAFVALTHGDVAAATEYVAESAAVRRALASPRGLLQCLEVYAAIAAAAGAHTQAARWYGAVDAAFGRLHASRSADPADAAEHERYAGMARAALGTRPYAAAYRAGSALSLDAALAEATATAEPEPLSDTETE